MEWREIDAGLFLVGVVHGDPQGYERALRLLEYLRPDHLTVEISPFSVRFRTRQERRWRLLLTEALANLPHGRSDSLALQRLAAQVALPFEYRAARDYRRSFGVSWKAVDLGRIARRHLPRYAGELLTPANVTMLMDSPRGDLVEFVRQEYQRARMAYRRGIQRLPVSLDEEARHRETLMARRLRRLTRSGGRLVHLGGWEHFLSRADGVSLWGKLADLHPVRFLLDEADVLGAGHGTPVAVTRLSIAHATPPAINR